VAIFLPERTATAATSLTPREVVAELDKHVIGQAKAKRAVAIALRNRIRRQRLPADIAEEVTPKNILMIGPTGVGKTEIARRLAKLAQSPFIKVEASKFTEVGYVGRDVESMVRDLVELAVDMVRAERSEDVKDKARAAAEERLLDLLLPRAGGRSFTERPGEPPAPGSDATREKLRTMLRDGKLDDREVEVELTDDNNPLMSVLGGQPGIDESALSGLKDMFGSFGRKTKRQKVTTGARAASASTTPPENVAPMPPAHGRCTYDQCQGGKWDQDRQQTSQTQR